MTSLPGAQISALNGPIMITGHTGFKGAWLNLLLNRYGIPTIGYSLPPQKSSLCTMLMPKNQTIEFFGDIRDTISVDSFIKMYSPAAIIHLAAQPLVLESYRKPRETFDINVMGTVNILESAFSNESVKAVLVVTTDKVYFNNNSDKSFIETDPLRGKDPYSASKVGVESAVAAWQEVRQVFGGPKVVSLRAGNVIGGGDMAENRLLPDIIRCFTDKRKLELRNPNSTRPWQHVLDPLNGYLLALEAILAGNEIQTVNFGPSLDSLSVAEVAEVALKNWSISGRVEVEFVNSPTISETTNLRLDSKLALETLGWSTKWTQIEAVTSTIKWWDLVLNEGLTAYEACQNDLDKLLLD